MTNATMRELYKFLAPRCGVSPRTMELFGRHLREVNLIGTGRPGRGGSTPEATPRSTSVLLIAVLAGGSAVRAAYAVRKTGFLNGQEINPESFETPLVPAGPFLDALAHIIEKMGDQSAHNVWRKCVVEVAVGTIRGKSGAWITVKPFRGGVARQYNYGGTTLRSSPGLARIGSLDGGTLVEIADLLRGHESGPTSCSGLSEKEA